MNIAVISTFFNRKENTLKCLSSLYNQDGIKDREISLDVYFCDDGSTDGTSDEIYERYPQVRIVEGTGNLFWTKGMSRALQEAQKKKHDFYLMVNDDVNFYPTMLQTMLNSYEKAKHRAELVAIVGSTQDANTLEWTYGGVIWNKRLRHEKYDPVLPASDCSECNITNWNCFLMPGSMLERIGFIDDFYEHGKADYDYSNRIVNSGNKIFVADNYIGTCQRNSLANTWRDEALPLKRRLELAKRPNGVPIKSELHYCKKFHGVAWPLWFAKRYVWIYLTSIKYSVQCILRK